MHLERRVRQSFSGNGKLLTDFGQDDAALAIAIQPNGRIVAAGTSGTIDRPEFIRPFAERFALTRYHGVTDNTLPDTVIDFAPSGTTTDSTPTFGFQSTEASSTFQCAIDGGSFVSCASPHTTAPLMDGAHTFRVRAIDAAGNVDPTPATRSFTVQTSSFQPDGRIRLDGDAAYVGDNVYNLTGDFQTCATTARRGDTRVYYVRAQNDGTATDTIRLRGCGGRTGFLRPVLQRLDRDHIPGRRRDLRVRRPRPAGVWDDQARDRSTGLGRDWRDRDLSRDRDLRLRPHPGGPGPRAGRRGRVSRGFLLPALTDPGAKNSHLLGRLAQAPARSAQDPGT